MSKNILLKKYNGTDWDVLHPITKAKNVISSAGGTVQDHIGAGGTAHAGATTSAAGFMSAADKEMLDAATSAATASTLAKRDPAGRLKAAAPAATDDVARKNETDAAVTAAAAAQSRADDAYTRADAAFTQASDGKTVVAAAITGKGIPASGSDTFPQLATKINSIQLATGNAVAGDVLAGKTFSNVSTTGATGTMPNRGAVALTPSTNDQTIAAGYHNGSGIVYGDADLAASNIKSGVNIFGVTGNVIQATGTAPASSLYIGHTASNAGGAITGTMPDSSTNITPSTSNQAIPAGYHNGGGVVYGDTDLSASNIKSGVNIFGVTGNVIQASGNADASQLLAGYSASNASGAISGSMPNNGAVGIIPSASNQAIAAGYHNGGGMVYGDPDLVAGNIVNGVDIFGVIGTAPKVLIASGETAGTQLGTAPNSTFTASFYVGFNPLVLTLSLAAGSIGAPVVGLASHLKFFPDPVTGEYWSFAEFFNLNVGSYSKVGGASASYNAGTGVLSVTINNSYVGGGPAFVSWKAVGRT